ncbi:hypothetical protein BmR1_04g05200 [Babesia microti strain RI]|uniref:Uncharacterized protein n=1 Tax=Babesia microti (strain RI) TaxID=1133968 RepID=I7J885_BABMR|nr:hypothetical protein BmR1_04g05200 [Babesia microti strain RI]CCF75238.1 hypothetical protein BmR1_04g05200 [Babesia microti strain RI]|eukprot:XP_012649646.1 hypothetical protein BmR1_04g05200 [Babesia microti strain RI]
MDSLISCALFLHEQLLLIQNLESKPPLDTRNTINDNADTEISKLLKISSSLNKIIFSKRKNNKVDFGKVVAPEYNLENLGLSAETIRFLRQSNTSIGD